MNLPRKWAQSRIVAVFMIVAGLGFGLGSALAGRSTLRGRR
jgi:hypothetical protein